VNFTVLVVETVPVALTLTEYVFVVVVEFGATVNIDVKVPDAHGADTGFAASAGVTETEHVVALLTAAVTNTIPPS
jgi:hypothetical protein